MPRSARYLSSTVTDPRIRSAMQNGEQHTPGLRVVPNVTPLAPGRRPIGGRRAPAQPAAAASARRATPRAQAPSSASPATPREALQDIRVLAFAERLASAVDTHLRR